MSNEQNPYLAPAAAEAAHDYDSQVVEPAAQWRRLLNLIVDTIAVFPLQLGAVMVLDVMMFGFGFADLELELTPQEQLRYTISSYLCSILTAVLYFIVLEASWGRTLGKFVTGTIVVSEDGTKPTLGQCVGRSLARLIPFEPLSFFGQKVPVGWHDSLAKTRVIRK